MLNMLKAEGWLARVCNLNTLCSCAGVQGRWWGHLGSAGRHGRAASPARLSPGGRPQARRCGARTDVRARRRAGESGMGAAGGAGWDCERPAVSQRPAFEARAAGSVWKGRWRRVSRRGLGVWSQSGRRKGEQASREGCCEA